MGWGLSGAAARRRGGLCLALLLLACRREPGGPKQPAGGPGGAPVAVGSPTAPEVDPTSRVFPVAQEDLLGRHDDGASLVFDRQRPRVGLRTKEGCDVWSLGDDAYVGRAPGRSCDDWIALSGDPRAPDRSRALSIAAGALEIRTLEVKPLAKPGPSLVLQGRALAPTCRAPAIARWSPDSQKIAVSCERDPHLYVLDASTGARTATLTLDPGQRIQSLAWGAAGLVAVVSPLASPSSCHCRADKLVAGKAEPAVDPDVNDEGLSGEVCQQILKGCAEQEGPLPSWVKGSPCRSPTQTRLRPDKQQVAIACAGESPRLVVASTTAPERTEYDGQLLSSDSQLCWHSGTLWLVGSFFDIWNRQSCDLEEADSRTGSLYVWSSLTAQPRIHELQDRDLQEAIPRYSSFYLDPLGRYVLQATGWRSGSALRTYDVTSGRLGPLGWTVNDNAQPPYSPDVSRWLPGKFPIWESIDSRGYLVTPNQHRAWRIYSAPGKRALALIDLGAIEKIPVSKVLDDGVTVVADPTAAAAAGVDLGHGASPTGDAGALRAVDPGGRFLATSRSSLRRIADGEELLFLPEHEYEEEHGPQRSVRTARGVFDGPLALVSGLVFRIGEDPARAAVVRGDQLASVLYHPGLLDDFFDGKPVSQPLLGVPLGLPPRLLEVAPVEVQPDGLIFHVRAEDGGDGATSIRRWVDDRPAGEALAITAGQPVTVPVLLPADRKRCSEVRLYACNRLGHVCSKAVIGEHCPPGVSPPDLSGSGR